MKLFVHYLCIKHRKLPCFVQHQIQLEHTWNNDVAFM